MTSDGERDAGDLHARHVRVVRIGHGANCSSVGSVIDTLFASAVVGGAIFAAVAAALAKEDVRVVPQSNDPSPRIRTADGRDRDGHGAERDGDDGAR